MSIHILLEDGFRDWAMEMIVSVTRRTHQNNGKVDSDRIRKSEFKLVQVRIFSSFMNRDVAIHRITNWIASHITKSHKGTSKNYSFFLISCFDFDRSFQAMIVYGFVCFERMARRCASRFKREQRVPWKVSLSWLRYVTLEVPFEGSHRWLQYFHYREGE